MLLTLNHKGIMIAILGFIVSLTRRNHTVLADNARAAHVMLMVRALPFLRKRCCCTIGIGYDPSTRKIPPNINSERRRREGLI